MVIKAIPTTYKKTKFRSKLEAHWAEWFDQYEIIWSYEIQGFNLEDGTWYLPDFYLPEIDTIVEVKGMIENIDKTYKLYKKIGTEYIIDKIKKLQENREKASPEDWDYNFLNTIFKPENHNELQNQCKLNMDETTMLLLAGPVPYFYDIDDWQSDGLWIRLCSKCGKNSILTQLGRYSCRCCGDYQGGNHPGHIEDLQILTKPLKWLLLERD